MGPDMLTECLKCKNKTCDYIASKGLLECLKHLHENGCPWDEEVFAIASYNGHIECLKYLHENGCPWYENVCYDVVEKGNIECLMYLHQRGYPCYSWVAGHAAYNGHLDCLVYLHKNKCPLDIFTMNLAAKNGHLECLKYLYENGCPVNQYTCHTAAKNGHLACLKYLYENGSYFKCSEDFFENNISDEIVLWYYMYIEQDLKNKYTIIYHNKVKLIQKAWLMHYYSPFTKSGMSRLERDINSTISFMNDNT
jgi:hypothetical protein